METNNKRICASENENDCRMCFVIMPFDNWHDTYYKDIYKPAIESCGYTSKRADDFFKPVEIMSDIWEKVKNAKILLADLSGHNPNVYYELGLAHAISKPVILIIPHNEIIPFDLKAIRHIIYNKNNPDWGEKLKESIEKALRENDILNSIPQVFKDEGIKNVYTLSSAIHESLNICREIGHLRIYAHSTSTIYDLMSKRLKNIIVKKCDIVLRKFGNSDNQGKRETDEQKIITRNIDYWEKLKNVENLSIYEHPDEISDYYIIIDDRILIAGMYYKDDTPSGIGFYNSMFVHEYQAEIIKMYISRFDKMLGTLKIYEK